MTLALKLDLDMVKIYLLCKNEVPMCSSSKQTDTQMDRWTDRHGRKHNLPAFMGGNNGLTKPNLGGFR